jgi:hypothetical protein
MSISQEPRWSTIDCRRWTVGWEQYRGTIRIVEEWVGDPLTSIGKPLELPFYIATVHQMNEDGKFTDLVSWHPTQSIDDAKDHCKRIASQLVANDLIERLGKHFSTNQA